MRYVVRENREISNGVYRLRLEFDEIPTPGQFIMINCGGNTLLKRPFSICDHDADEITIVYRIKGKGTYNLSKVKALDTLEVTGPHGHGFDMFDKFNNILIVGGGIGIPPLLFLSKKLKSKNLKIVLGFKSDVFLVDEFKKYGDVVIATEDGNTGIKGHVTDAMKGEIKDIDMIYGCGPMQMLKSVKDMAEKYDVPCQISVEEHMGCGIGACMVCACKTKTDSGFQYKKVCKDGPVFWSREVVF